MMIFIRLQRLMQTVLHLGFQHLLLGRRMPVSATWHTMASLLDGNIMPLEGKPLAKQFVLRLQCFFFLFFSFGVAHAPFACQR